MGYQMGALERRNTPRGWVYYLRFRRPGARPRVEVGAASDFYTKADLKRALEKVRQEFNNPSAAKPTAMLFRKLISDYETKETPKRYSTSKSYRSMVKVHVLPRWGDIPVIDVQPEAVKTWLLSIPLAPKTQSHIKGLMSVLFKYAMFVGDTPPE